MQFNQDFAVVHSYLCADGYVIKNPPNQKHKYYMIGFRNTNRVLLEDFKRRFERCFGIKAYITSEGRCRAGSKRVYEQLTKNESFYCEEWRMPRLKKHLLRHWLRAFFDCEGWVYMNGSQTRMIGLECKNGNGIQQVKNALNLFGVKSILKKRKRSNGIMLRLDIFGKKNLVNYEREIGFLHPLKKQKLIAMIKSYKTYDMCIPSEKSLLCGFIRKRGRIRKDRGEIRINSIKRKSLLTLKKALSILGVASKLHGPWVSGTGSAFYCLSFKEENFNAITK